MFNVKEYVDSIIAENTALIGLMATVDSKGEPDNIPLSFIRIGDQLICATDKTFHHSDNVKGNPNVAVSFVEGITFKGVASLCGGVLDKTNSSWASLYKSVYPKNWQKYSCLENQVFLSVDLCSVKLWRYIDGVPFLAGYNYSTIIEYCNEYLLDE